MRRDGDSRWAPILLAAVLVVGCGGSEEPSAPASDVAAAQAPARPRPPVIRELEGVDTSGLDASNKEMWTSLVNDLLSPCGEPLSVARCIADRRRCGRCRPAARYIARLVGEGFERSEIRDFFRLRYAADGHSEIELRDAPVLGAAMAPVTIVTFSDFECPHCRAAHPMLEQLVAASEGRVQLAFKNYPLSGHPHARDAAIAAAAAQRQNKFWEMADKLFENQDRLERADLERYAQQVGLDMARFRRDLEDEALGRRVDADRAEGRALGVDSTPTIFVEGRRYELPLELLPAYLEEELES